MRVLIINLNQFNLSKDEFVKPIEQILKKNQIEFEIKHIFQITGNSIEKKNENLNIDIKKNLEKFDKIILSGTALKDFHYLNLLDEFNWIKNTNKSILGICAGCQVIAKIFGSKLIENSEIGMFEISKTKKNILFEEEKLKVYCLHNKSFKENDNFEVLARSDKCIQIIKHKNKDIYGVLFHPEVKNEKIIENFIKNS